MVAKNIITVFNIIKEGLDFMSMFGDYKAYKRYEPAYANWKQSRDIMDAKRLEYLKQNPQEYNPEDVQRGKTLLRAIDIMDEYSQKRAEDTEVATESAVGWGTDLAVLAGGALGYSLSKFKGVQKFLGKFTGKGKSAEGIASLLSTGLGAVFGMVAAFPLYAWASKIEVSASRRGRFEAMRKDLKSPNGFAVLTPEQIQQAKIISQNIQIPKEKDSLLDFGSGFKSIRDMIKENEIYKAQRREFEAKLEDEKVHLNDKMSPEEVEKAQKDQQLLTKLVEKIDIASQDYAENVELLTGTATVGLVALGSLFSALLGKVLNALKIKSASKISSISWIASFLSPIVLSIFAAQVQKEAARVGRYKAKMELLKNPEQLVYVSDENANKISGVSPNTKGKTSMIQFIKDIWKNTGEYNKYKKTSAIEEKRFYKALEYIKLSPEQLKDAETLQKNTFMTFNKVDENSQKFAESIEALGNAINMPVMLISTLAGGLIASKSLNKILSNTKVSKLEQFAGISKFASIMLLSCIPGILLNAYITKEQKQASRIADMLAINELSDYRQFRG